MVQSEITTFHPLDYSLGRTCEYKSRQSTKGIKSFYIQCYKHHFMLIHMQKVEWLLKTMFKKLLVLVTLVLLSSQLSAGGTCSSQDVADSVDQRIRETLANFTS